MEGGLGIAGKYQILEVLMRRARAGRRGRAGPVHSYNLHWIYAGTVWLRKRSLL